MVADCALYPRLLGPAWEQVPAAVRQLHLEKTPVNLLGTFRVRHGGRLAQFLTWLLGMPRAGEGVKTHLTVTLQPDGECWHRSFAGRPFVTTQYECVGGLLAERQGMTELRIRLEVDKGSIVYHSVGFALCVGRWRIPLPRWLGPRVTARESQGDVPECTAVVVEVRVPVLGLLITYDGILWREVAQ